MHATVVNRPVWIARGVLAPVAGSGEQSPPGSGSTIIIFDSTGLYAGTNATENAPTGGQFNTPIPFGRIVLTVKSSADSAASGVLFEGSEDNGLNWDNMVAAQQYIAASGLVTFDTLVSAPQVRVRYINSASVLTTWRMSLQGIIADRTKGT